MIFLVRFEEDEDMQGNSVEVLLEKEKGEKGWIVVWNFFNNELGIELDFRDLTDVKEVMPGAKESFPYPDNTHGWKSTTIMSPISDETLKLIQRHGHKVSWDFLCGG